MKKAIIWILALVGLLIALFMLLPIILGLFMVSKVDELQQASQALNDKAAISEAIKGGIDRTLAQPEVQESLENISDAYNHAESIRDDYFLAEHNLLVFTSSQSTDLSTTNLEFIKDGSEKVVFSKPIQRFDASNLGASTIVYTHANNTPYTDKLIVGRLKEQPFFAVDVSDVPSGEYLVQLEQPQQKEGIHVTKAESIFIPQRRAWLDLQVLTKDNSVNTLVGSQFDVDLAIHNKGLSPSPQTQLFVAAGGQELSAMSPSLPAHNVKQDHYLITIPPIKAKATYPIKMRFNAVAYAKNLRVTVKLKDTDLQYPNPFEFASDFHNIGSIQAGNTNAGNEDPMLLVTEKRWAYCRSKHSDEAAAKDCARNMAQRDLPCLKRGGNAEQLSCIYEIYGR